MDGADEKRALIEIQEIEKRLEARFSQLKLKADEMVSRSRKEAGEMLGKKKEELAKLNHALLEPEKEFFHVPESDETADTRIETDLVEMLAADILKRLVQS